MKTGDKVLCKKTVYYVNNVAHRGFRGLFYFLNSITKRKLFKKGKYYYIQADLGTGWVIGSEMSGGSMLPKCEFKNCFYSEREIRKMKLQNFQGKNLIYRLKQKFFPYVKKENR